MSTVAPRPVSRQEPARQEGRNRPSDDTAPRLRAELNREALTRVPDPAKPITLQDRVTKRANQVSKQVKLGKPVWWRPHVTEQDVQVMQFVGVWLVGVVFALMVHGVYWLIAG
jgi:hypothetical protein